jgi:hypothetical protein
MFRLPEGRMNLNARALELAAESEARMEWKGYRD